MSDEVVIKHFMSFDDFLKDRVWGYYPDPVPEPVRLSPSDPNYYKTWMNEYIQSNAPPVNYREYFLVISHNPAVSSKREWFDRLCKFVLSSGLHKKMQLSLEHIDSNIHCNAYVSVKHPNISHKKYTTWYKNKYGNIHVQGPVKTDQGILNYISKENKVFDNLPDFINYYGPQIP